MSARVTTKHRIAAALLAGAAVAPGWAQNAQKPERPEKPDSADAAAAMERAQRLANNPLRAILEASRIRRKGDAEAAPEAADSASLRRTAARGDATAPLARSAGSPAAEPESEPPQSPLVTLAADATLAQPLVTAVPALQSDVAPQPLLPLPDATPKPLPSPELAALLVQPKLVAVVEPVMSPRLIEQVGRVSEVEAELTIRADGSVGDVTVLPPAPRPMHRPIVEALQQWRFEPLPAERRHRVQLVFRNER